MASTTRSSLLPPLSAAATKADIDASTELYPTHFIISILLEIGGYLVSLNDRTTLFGRSTNDPYSPSLRTLYIRLRNGQLNPSPMQSHANQAGRIKATLGQRIAKDAEHRPLEDFEDLYYAILARMQDIHQIMNARLGSGFSTSTDRIHKNGPSFAALHVDISQYWGALNEPEFVKTLDSAVRRSRVRYLHQELIAQVDCGDITQADAYELLSDLYDPEEYDNVEGLAWINGLAPGMVAAWLEEKYRIVLQVEKEDAESKEMCMDTDDEDVGHQASRPQYGMRSKKEGKENVDNAKLAGGAVGAVQEVDQQAEEQLIMDLRRQQDELQHAIEWEMKAQRVSEYTRYLRSIASCNARYIVDSNAARMEIRRNSMYVEGPVQRTSNGGMGMRGGNY